MTMVLWRNICLTALLCLACFPHVAGARSADVFFDSSLGDYAAELKVAQQQGKRGVLLVFEAEGCPYCRRMREQILSQAPVQQYFRAHFNIFAVDFLGSVNVTDFAGKEVTEKAFARAQRVSGTPTFLFIAVDGKEATRYTGAARDAAEFMALGRYVVEGHHEKMTFEQYYPARRSPR